MSSQGTSPSSVANQTLVTSSTGVEEKVTVNMDSSGIRKRSGSKRWVLLAAVVVAAVGIASAQFLRPKAAAITYFSEPVQRGAVRNAVNATGIVQAVLTVQVGSQVSGQIQALYADYNSVVKRGQLLARIDPRNFEAQVEQAKANVAASQARVQTAEAELKNQLANLESAKANLEAGRVARDNTAQIFRRFTELQQGGIVSQNDYDNAKANAEGSAARYTQAAAAVEQVQAQINSGRAQVEQAKAQVEQAKAALNQSQVNLDYTSINSPVDGVVISRNVDVGQTVAASLQAPVLYLIARDLTQMQVNASVDEADIGNISDEVGVQFTVDAFRNDTFRGTITEIRLNPLTVQNVVTYSVIISVDNDQMKLKPGMTANIRMTVAQRDNVLKVPNAALRYMPPGTTREQVAQMVRQPQGQMASAGNPPGGATDLDSGTSERGQGRSDPGRGESDSGQGRRNRNSSPGGEQRGFRQNFQPGRPERGDRPRAGERAAEASAQPAPTNTAPGQFWNPAEKIQFPRTNRRSARPAILWVLGPDKKPQPRQVVLGITDGVVTELVSGELKEGDKIIVADSTQGPSPQRPGGGQRPGGLGPFGFRG